MNVIKKIEPLSADLSYLSSVINSGENNNSSIFSEYKNTEIINLNDFNDSKTLLKRNSLRIYPEDIDSFELCRNIKPTQVISQLKAAG